MMIKKKNGLFALALVSVALSTGCAKGLGSTPSVSVSTNPANQTAVGVHQTLQFVATVTGTSNTGVNWTVSCKSSDCGAIQSSGVYTAPDTLTSGSLGVTVTATSQADAGGKGQQTVNVLPIKVSVTPGPTVSVGQGLSQQFTAVATPDNVAQTFTWTCTQASGAACVNFAADATVSGLATYTAAESPCSSCITVTATSTANPSSPPSGSAKATVVSSRIAAATYTFRFNGYDSANHPVATAGSATFGSNGTVVSGVEDVVINGVHQQYATVTGAYTPAATGSNTNNAGTLTLSAGGGPTFTYSAVVDAAGNLRMIESDGNGIGSGSLEKSATGQFNTAAQTFAFGFTGVDVNGKRVGYAGVLPMTPGSATNGTISGGMADTNDNGRATGACASPPCSVSGTYQFAGGVWTMHLLLGSETLDFDLYIESGQTTANTKTPLALFAISTDALDAAHPALSGRMLFQDPSVTYDKTALNSDSVSHLTGVDSTGSNTLVSLVAATGDGNGNLNNLGFDSNNAGTIVAAATTLATCGYTTGTGGRYVVTLLGTSSSCMGGVPFVFYASGANRGFLLDQSSAAVMTGAMVPQAGNGTFAPSALPNTYAVGTVSNATSGVSPMVANLLLTSPGNQVYNVGGTQYPGPVSVTGTYTLILSGTGTIVLTAPAAHYVIYATDNTHFEMIDVDKTVTNPSVIFAQP